MKHHVIAALAALIASGPVTQPALAEETAGIKRTVLERADLLVPGREVILVRVELAPGAAVEKHFHPGDEVVYVLEGAFEFEIEGRPKVTLEAGQTLFIPSGASHSAKNAGAVNAVELVTYIVEIGKTLLYMGP